MLLGHPDPNFLVPMSVRRSAEALQAMEEKIKFELKIVDSYRDRLKKRLTFVQKLVCKRQKQGLLGARMRWRGLLGYTLDDSRQYNGDDDKAMTVEVTMTGEIKMLRRRGRRGKREIEQKEDGDGGNNGNENDYGSGNGGGGGRMAMKVKQPGLMEARASKGADMYGLKQREVRDKGLHLNRDDEGLMTSNTRESMN
ncbi:hypothetical protein CPB84DRAFT_1753126 [Gymnopilus junonius]|uniref:Uncharacterized protein n=1 Tax=Gymnopilus junonius TaxID=109634 RepID=A0A9P5N851_GYMJU|nr:hypothetical protein CPB84DRAFT_1753126 [Gymnopilus junonius]